MLGWWLSGKSLHSIDVLALVGILGMQIVWFLLVVKRGSLLLSVVVLVELSTRDSINYGRYRWQWVQRVNCPAVT